MGLSFSEPIPEIGFNYICIYLRQPDLCRIMHATSHVVQAITNIVKDLDKHEAEVIVELKNGATQITLPEKPFMHGTCQRSAIIGKLFVIRLLEVMHSLGYDYMFSSDLSRAWDHSSLFFKKTPISCNGRDALKMVCVAPGGTDKIILMHHTEQVKETIRGAISSSWHWGIKHDKEEVHGELIIHEFQLNGNPWFAITDESVEARRLVLEIITRMANIGFQLHANVNIKGGTDTLFFTLTEDCEGYNPQLAILSLTLTDRLRLINFDHFDSDVTQLVEDTIVRFYQTSPPKVRDYHGSTEFKLNGNPFCCLTPEESILTRQLICRLLEAFATRGWAILTTLDISRKTTDKSVFILQRTIIPECSVIVGSISLNDKSKIRLINFPPDITEVLREIITSQYKPGIVSEKERSLDCHQIHLDGEPWTHNSSYGLHARSLMILLLRAANCRGWKMVASVDVSAKCNPTRKSEPSYPEDVHSWFFAYGGRKYNLKMKRRDSCSTSSTTLHD